MKKYKVVILVAFLAGLTLFSVVKYISLQKENYYLYDNLKQIKVQIDSLETQRQKLLQTIEKQNQENSVIRDNLKAAEDKLAKMDADFRQAQKTIAELNSLTSSLKDQSENLKAQLSQASKEKDILLAKLNSLEELKKTLRDLKRKIRQAKIGLLKKNNASLTQDGNRGFVIKNGKSTYPTKVKIEVNPAPSF